MAEAAEGHTPRRRGRKLARVLLVAVVLVSAAGGYGVYWWVTLRGTVGTEDAYVDAQIVSSAARMAGPLAEVLVQEGMAVTRGQVLARFVDGKLRTAVELARAEVARAQAALTALEQSPRPEEVAVAQAELAVTEVELARNEDLLARAGRLSRSKLLSVEELEARRADVMETRSRVQVQRRRLALLKAGPKPAEVAEARAELDVSRQRFAAAELELRDATVLAPVNGVVARRSADPGEVVDRGQALFQIVSTDRTWVVANLEEDVISQVHPGQPVQVWLDAYPQQAFQGRVASSYAATLSRFSLLPSSSASGNFIKVKQRVPVRIDWDQEDIPPVYPGLNAVIRIQVDGTAGGLPGLPGLFGHTNGGGDK